MLCDNLWQVSHWKILLRNLKLPTLLDSWPRTLCPSFGHFNIIFVIFGHHHGDHGEQWTRSGGYRLDVSLDPLLGTHRPRIFTHRLVICVPFSSFLMIMMMIMVIIIMVNMLSTTYPGLRASPPSSWSHVYLCSSEQLGRALQKIQEILTLNIMTWKYNMDTYIISYRNNFVFIGSSHLQENFHHYPLRPCMKRCVWE